MIIYRGLGFLALICYVATAVVIASVLNWGFGLDVLVTPSWWPLHLTLFAGAVATFGVGLLLNREPVEETIYERTGPKTVSSAPHTLYYVRMEYWGPIIFVVYVVASIVYQLK
jgi:hypothetical protein